MTRQRILLAAALALTGLGRTQSDPRRVELDAKLAKQLVSFARSASSQKAHTLAREVATLVIEHYDADSSGARRVLGQRKVRGDWQRDGKPLPDDAVKPKRLQSVERKWKQLQQRAGQLHKDLATALIEAGAPEAARTRELELALRHLPNDAEVHRALGHSEVHGYWGDAEDVAFVERMRALVDKAVALRTRAVPTEQVPEQEMPVELRNMGIPMFGAKSARYTYWSSESVEAAAKMCVWSERAHELLAHLLGPKADAVRSASWSWHLVLRDEAQRDLLLQLSPSTRGPFTFEQARLFAGIGFRCEAGGRASATWHEPTLDSDHAVANVTKRHFLDLRNEGLGEGLNHVMTWILCGSVHTYFADLPKTVAGDAVMPRDPDKWIERLWDEIDQGEDMPLVVVPRERADNFRDSTRLKAWSFMHWMLARYPDKWLPLIDGCGIPKITPEGVEAVFLEVLGRPLEEIEREWRAWARRGSKLGEASGWGEKR